MSSVPHILSQVEKDIANKEELSYFWTHSVRYKVILEQIEKISDGKKYKILDIGCFPYHVGKALELMGHEVYGIASSHEPVKNSRIAVLNIEHDSFPFKNNFFDLVLCNEVVEHLPQTPLFVLQEMYRVTKKGGMCMVTTPNIARSINRGKLLLGYSIMYPISVFFENNKKGNNIYHRHNREYTLSELTTLVVSSSWRIYRNNFFISYTPFRKRVQKDSFSMFLGKFINYIFMLVLPFMQDTLMVLGKKD